MFKGPLYIFLNTCENKFKTEIKFNSIARNGNGEIVEDMNWRAVVDYEIDQIDTNLPPESRFNFAVTDYQVQLLEDKKQK